MAKNMGGSCFFCIFGFGFWDRFRVGFGALLGAEYRGDSSHGIVGQHRLIHGGSNVKVVLQEIC